MTGIRVAAAVAVIATVLAAPGVASAHRLDEYLQATRLDISGHALVLEVDLTPGSEVASLILPLIDVDGDDIVSAVEAGAYSARVARDLRLSLDGRPLPIAFMHREFPDLAILREGRGTIRLAATIPAAVSPGHHEVAYANGHVPDHSVYLVNALVPSDAHVRFAAPRRDASQRTFAMDVEVQGPAWRTGWSLIGLAAIGLLVAGRRR